MKSRIGALALSVCCLTICSGADWTAFRGPLATNVAAPQEKPPTNHVAGKIAFTKELPGRGLSSPIIVQDRVFVTCSSGYAQDRLHVLCFSASSGEKLWERQFWSTGTTNCHPKTCIAAPTPCSDGERIFASFSSNDVVCLNLDGVLQWYRGLTHDFPNASNSLGMASSPVVTCDTFIVQVETDDDSFATGLDVATGIARWKAARPNHVNWTSPTIIPGETPEQNIVLLQSTQGLSAIYPRTGEEMWSYDDGASSIPSSTFADGLVLAPSHGVTALKPGDSSQPPEQVWRSNRLQPATSSPVALAGNVYTINRAGVIACADTATGELKWNLRLTGPFSSTPLLAAGHLYCVSEKGLIQVVQLPSKAGEKAAIVSKYDLQETILGSPVVADNGLYLRSDRHLWKFSD